MITKYTSDRTFVVQQYTVFHHQRLLLRSSRETPTGTRIDLHVGGVTAMLLRPSYTGLTIREGTEADRERVAALLGLEVFRYGGRLHVIGGDQTTGFVVGGPLECRETHADDDEPSGFLHMPATA